MFPLFVLIAVVLVGMLSSFFYSRIARSRKSAGPLRPKCWEADSGERRPSPTELSVLEQLAENGLDDRSLASVLGMKPRMVEVHLRSLMDKLGADTRAHLVAKAYQLGLVEPGSTRHRVFFKALEEVKQMPDGERASKIVTQVLNENEELRKEIRMLRKKIFQIHKSSPNPL